MEIPPILLNALPEAIGALIAVAVLAIWGWMKRQYIRKLLEKVHALTHSNPRPAVPLFPEEWLRHHGLDPASFLMPEHAEQWGDIHLEDIYPLGSDHTDVLQGRVSVFCFGAKGTGKTFRFRLLEQHYEKEWPSANLLYVEFPPELLEEVAEEIARQGTSYVEEFRRRILELAVDKILEESTSSRLSSRLKALESNKRDPFLEMLCRYYDRSAENLKLRLKQLLDEDIPEQNIQRAKKLVESPLHDLRQLSDFFQDGCFVLVALDATNPITALCVAPYIAQDRDLLRHVCFKIFVPQEWMGVESEELRIIKRICEKGDLARFMTLEWSEQQLRYFLREWVVGKRRKIGDLCEKSLADEIENLVIQACAEVPSPGRLLGLLQQLVRCHVREIMDPARIERKISQKTWGKALQQWKQQQYDDERKLDAFPTPVATALRHYYDDKSLEKMRRAFGAIVELCGILVCKAKVGLVSQRQVAMLAGQEGQIDFGALRELIRRSFTPKDLKRFCHDRPDFQHVVSSFPENPSLEDMIDKLVRFCQTRDLLDALLPEIQEARPRQYQRYESKIFKLDALPDKETTISTVQPVPETYPPITPSWADIVGMANELPEGSLIRSLVLPLANPSPASTKLYDFCTNSRVLGPLPEIELTEAFENLLASWKSYLEGTEWIKLENAWQDTNGETIRAQVRRYRGVSAPGEVAQEPVDCPFLLHEGERGRVLLVRADEDFYLPLHPLLISAYCAECGHESLFIYRGPAESAGNAVYRDAADHTLHTCWYRDALHQVFAALAPYEEHI